LVRTTFLENVSEESNSSENWAQPPCSTYMIQKQYLFAPYIIYKLWYYVCHINLTVKSTMFPHHNIHKYT
jgi:hypothetical protein